MDVKKYIRSRHSKILIFVIGALLIALVSFGAGMSVGFHKARFSYRFGENYDRNFAGPPRGPMGMFGNFEDRGFRNGHGAAGVIISINGNNLVIKNPNGDENTAMVTDKTIIKKRHEDIEFEDLQQNDPIVVIGTPNDNGVIQADIIRVFENFFNQNTNTQMN